MAMQQCDFTACGDKCGVIAWLGKKKGAAEWSNPQASGEVEVCMSSTAEGTPDMLVDGAFSTQTLCTKNEVNSWCGVDLKSAEACPSIYVLAHRAGSNDGMLRSWNFEGSADGATWESLDDRTDDSTMNAQAPFAAYAITPTEKFSRFFRIKMKPSGNDAKTDTLTISCFDIYGKCRPLGGGAPMGGAPAGGGMPMMGGKGGPAMVPPGVDPARPHASAAAGMKRGGELRISPKNGRCYDMCQFVSFFGGSPQSCPAWDAAQPAPPDATFGSKPGEVRGAKGGFGAKGPMPGMPGMAAPGMGAGGQPERRIDMTDGLAYTYQQFAQQYGAQTPARWAAAPIAQVTGAAPY